MEVNSQPEIYIEDRIGAYDGFFTTDQALSLGNATKESPQLYAIVEDLVLDWRSIAYTASMPGILISSLHSVTSTWSNFKSPDSSILSFADAVLVALSHEISELVTDSKLRSKLRTALVSQAANFRDAHPSDSNVIDIEKLWNDYMKIPPFQMSIWSSQRVAYTAFYNAYEAFLVECAKKVLERDQLRTGDKEFKSALRKSFDVDISDPCWFNQSLNTANHSILPV